MENFPDPIEGDRLGGVTVSTGDCRGPGQGVVDRLLHRLNPVLGWRSTKGSSYPFILVGIAITSILGD